MAKSKSNFAGKFFSFIVWLTGIIVSLAVAFGMINGVLTLPSWFGGEVVAYVFGWIVVVTTLLGVVLAVARSMD